MLAIAGRCSHWYSYCFARLTDEYLGLNAGLDFEPKVVVKEDAPELFRDFLSKDGWRPEPIALAADQETEGMLVAAPPLTCCCFEGVG